MEESAIDLRIAANVRGLRQGRGLSLEGLAATSGVSRSMISRVERGESSPTAVVLDKLAVGLGVTLASLFDGPQAPDEPVARRAQQRGWQDPGSGYRRRNVSPSWVPQPFQIVEVRFPAGARVAFETSDVGRHQQIWLLEGVLEVAQGAARHRLEEGDCLAMKLDCPAVFHNPGEREARYAVVIEVRGS